MKDILVIGGSNIDYLATSDHPLIAHDSNIGKLKVSFGGVARNVVENLARLSDKVTFITGIGQDANGLRMKRELRTLKVKVLSPDIPYPSSSYLAVYDSNGDMTVAICDSSIMDKMSYQDIIQFRDVLAKHRHIVMDANLNEEVIDYLFKNYFSHLFYVEAVSANKVIRYRNHISQIYVFKSNLLEAQYLLDKKADAVTLAKDLLAQGVKNVVITDGPRPVTCAQGTEVFQVPVKPVEKIVNENGAGDAMFAGIIHDLKKEKSLKEAVQFGVEMASATLEAPGAVDEEIGKLTPQL
jgi:pseudouridine kinase